ncbi:MAG: ABC transporter substrate binding protein [Burkholderiales bacterium]
MAIGTLKEIEAAFPAMIKDKAQALVFTTTPLLFEYRQRIADLAIKHRLPFVSSFKEFTEAGGLASYGLSLANNYRLAATYVDKILKGAKPADLPVEEPTILERYVNRDRFSNIGCYWV